MKKVQKPLVIGRRPGAVRGRAAAGRAASEPYDSNGSSVSSMLGTSWLKENIVGTLRVIVDLVPFSFSGRYESH